MSCPSSCCLPFWRQCDRSAVAALWVEVPRVARGLVSLARARPTAILFDRSAVGALWVEVPRVARGLVALARARPTAILFDRSAVVAPSPLFGGSVLCIPLHLSNNAE